LGDCGDRFSYPHPLRDHLNLIGSQRKQPAPWSEPSTATGRGTGAATRLACGAAGGKCRELLFDPLPFAFGALRQVLVAGQHEFFEDMSAVGTCVFKYGHRPLPMSSD
jgi:hypothetical protein